MAIIELEAQIKLDTRKFPNNVIGTTVEVKADGHIGSTSFMDSELSIGLIEVKGTLLFHSWSLLVNLPIIMQFQVLSQDMNISMRTPTGEMDSVRAVVKDVVDVSSKVGFILWEKD